MRVKQMAVMRGKTGVEEQRDALWRLTGASAIPAFTIVARQDVPSLPGVMTEELRLRAGSSPEVRAFFTRPTAAEAPMPAVLYCHAHGGRYAMGADELIAGRAALQTPAYGAELAANGIAALAIDLPCFGERAVETESSLSKRLLWNGHTLFGAMLADLRGALDLLAREPMIDAQRIGVMGLSMGATLAFWLGALEPRLKAVAHLCSFADLATLIAENSHDRHGIYMTIPGLLRQFSTGEIAGLVAPRPQLVCLGRQDPLTPPAAIDKGLADLEFAYRDARRHLSVLISDETGHVETPQMREAMLSFLRAKL